MFALLRLSLMLFVVLTVIYFSLVFYMRAGERARLREEWAEEQPPLPLETYVENGIREYQSSLKRKLLWGVYILPFSAIAVLIYVINFL